MMDEPEANPGALPDPFLRLRAGDVACPAPVFVDEGASVAQAAKAMARAGATAALVRRREGAGGGDGLVLGILTERDVLSKVVAQDRDAATLPAAEVMTRQLVTVGAEDLLIEAFSRMVHQGIRRLVLVDASGRPVGILGERDMLAARGESPLALAQDIAAAHDQPGLARAFERLHRMAGQSVAEGIGSQAVGRLISEMHDHIMAKAWTLAMGAVEAELGPAPAPHAILVLGSQGRREQFLATDQDLALVYDAPASDAETAREADIWFDALGERLTDLLLAVGFPPCPKRIMLDNPDWRDSLDGWLDSIDAIAERPDADGVVRAALLADMRPMAGDLDLGLRLRAAMLARLREATVLLKYLAREAVRFSPPLAGGIGGILGGVTGGSVGGLAVHKDGPKKGTLDVKRGGVFPVTLGAKVLALSHGLDATSTSGRLKALEGSGALSTGLALGLRDACDFLQTLRMRHQAAQLRQGQPTDNDIRPDALGALELDRLRASFKLVAEFQSLLFEKFGLRMFG